ncbi:hypothetical protein [Pseudomonas sp. RIT-PI-AD]|uniref:hypothetical protein n=1 Tax=Pseudomonas sp. RIT-PI-AD TaxID=3035294 RepID=UPI0021D87C2D|nr:hypothetical protein [Pseudomonas sp. RIT-PI-AD]
MEFIDLLQWPAMLVTIVAAWLIGSLSKQRRTTGFWCFLFSNALWITWGWHDQAYALLILQVCLAVSNIRGLIKNHSEVK